MRSSHTRNREALSGILLATPYLLLMLAFGVAPIALTIHASLTETSLANPAGGVQNFLLVVQDFRFLPALVNVGVFLAIYLPTMLIVVATMAVLLDAVKARWALPLRLAYIVPASISGSVAILVWYFLLEPSLSPYRVLLEAIGITQSTQIWNSQNLVWIFAAMAFFTGAGNWIVIQYGSLQSIPEEILEAARLDGCSAFQTAWLVKLPLIKKYLVYMGVLTFAAGLQVFVEPQLISSSVYPGLAADWSLNQLSYALAFASGNLGSSAALSLMLLIVCAFAALFVIFRTDFFDGAGVKK